jgi:polyisoprenoid-binding protein YceI
MPLRRFVTWTTATLLAIGASQEVNAAVTVYVLDPVHTQVVFFADHLGFSHGIGRLHIQQGWFQFDEDDWSTARADVVVDVASLDMGEKAWTDKVLSAQFLDAQEHPTARFIGNRLEKTSASGGVLHGDLWLRGVHRALTLEVTFNRTGNDPYAFKEKAGFSARAQLDRFAFGMQTYREVVGGPVELRIEVEGVRSRSGKPENPTDANEKQ